MSKKNLSPADDPNAYIIRPIKAYPFLETLSSTICYISLFLMGIAVGVWGWIKQTDPNIPWLQENKWIILLVFSIGVLIFLLTQLYYVIQYTQIRYIFTNSGITLEAGINFTGDFISWKQINDVNLHRSVLQRLMKCGTIELVCSDYSSKQLIQVPESHELYWYLKNKIGEELNNARRIVRG